MKTFKTYYRAEEYAKNQAQAIVLDGEFAPNRYILMQKKSGNPLSETEKNCLISLYGQTLLDQYQKIMTSLILNGFVKPCKMSRRFMDSGQIKSQ